MMHWRLRSSIKASGEQPISVEFSYLAESNQKPEEGSFAGWSLELPPVLMLLEAIDQGKLPAGDVRSTILAALAKFTERSECCLVCEDAIPRYEEALAEHQREVEQLEQDAREMTPESHPYIINSNGTVHVWDCYVAPSLGPSPHPGATVQEYTHRPWWEYEMRDRLGTRVTFEELADWIEARRGPRGGAGHRRCKACQPALPGAYTSEASDVQ